MEQITYCFEGGKHKVVTFSYDDGRIEDRQLVSMMNRYGLKGTFHLNGGLLHHENRVQPDEIKDLYQGHEVAAHTFTHPTIERSPKEALIHEIMADRSVLEELVGYPVCGLSYPNGSYTPEIMALLPHLGIEYARVVGGHGGYHLPKDLYAWQATCHHKRQVIEHCQQFIDLQKTQYLYMLYIWGHSYEFTEDHNWGLMEKVCETLGGKTDIWYATNIEYVRYRSALKALKFNVACTKVHNTSSQTVWLKVGQQVIAVKSGDLEDLT